MDKLTVLETVGPCLTKTYKSDGTTDSTSRTVLSVTLL